MFTQSYIFDKYVSRVFGWYAMKPCHETKPDQTIYICIQRQGMLYAYENDYCRK